MNKQLRTIIPVKPVVVGKIGSAYGIKGWLRIFSSTNKAESIFDYQPWFIKKVSEWQLIKLENWKHHNHGLIIKVIGIESREAATLLTNYKIIIDMSQLPDLDNGEYYWKDLLGCQVINTNGYQLGNVIGLMATGSNDVLVVKTNLTDNFGIQKRLIPFLNGSIVKNVNLTTLIIEVDWDPTFDSKT